MSGWTGPGGWNNAGLPAAPAVPPADGLGVIGIGARGVGGSTPPSIFAEPLSALQVEGEAVGEGGLTPSPFARAIRSLRNDRLMRIAGGLLGKVADLPDDYILENLRAAEVETERDLRVFLTPREIIPDGTPYQEVQFLASRGVPMVEEPGYPYTTAIFQGMDLDTRHRPIITVRRVWYAYQGSPQPAAASEVPLYDIPLDWVQVDRKYGRINLLPTSNFTQLPLNAFLLSVLGAGREIPFGLKVRYSAGLTDVPNTYPDLMVLIKRRAVVSMLDDRFLTQSGSVSADGLSQSMSIDVDKYRSSVEAGLGKIASQLKGVRMGILG